MTATLDALLAPTSIYSAFNRDPKPALALRIHHASGGARWSVSNRVLRIATDAHPDDWHLPPHVFVPTLPATMNLTGATLANVVTFLEASEMTVVYQNSELLGLAADTLLEGAGREAESNGDHLYVYTSLLWSLLDSFAIGLETAERDGLTAGLRQAYLETAQGSWLDQWGSFFGVPRNPDESDADYLARTVLEVLRPRNNAWAIAKAVKDELGLSLDIYEPWQDIFIFNQSTWSGAHHFQDGSFYTWTVIQPILRDLVPVAVRDRVLRIVNRNRAAGVLVVNPFPPPPEHLDFPWPPTAQPGRSLRRGVFGDFRSGVLDESLVLSDTFPERTVEFEFRFHGTVTFGGGIGHTGMFAPARYWRDLGNGWDTVLWTQGVFPDFQLTHT